MKAAEIMAKLQAKYSHEPEYLQAVHEVLEYAKFTWCIMRE